MNLGQYLNDRGAFHQMPITAESTACIVNGVRLIKKFQSYFIHRNSFVLNFKTEFRLKYFKFISILHNCDLQ